MDESEWRAERFEASHPPEAVVLHARLRPRGVRAGAAVLLVALRWSPPEAAASRPAVCRPGRRHRSRTTHRPQATGCPARLPRGRAADRGPRVSG